MPADFSGAFAALRQILKKHAAGMIVQSDTPTDFTVVTPAIGPNKKPLWFGAVLSKKSAVTYHLMPLYYNPKLQASVRPELKARMQGKTCFNFQRPDPDLFAGLDELTLTAREHWRHAGFLEPGPVSPERFAAALAAGGTSAAVVAQRRKTVLAKAAAKRAITKRAQAAKPGPTRGPRK